MNKIEAPYPDKTEQLVDTVLRIVFKKLAWQEKAAPWLNALNEYNKLLRQTGPEGKIAKSLVAKTADHLLKNPQEIEIAETVWKTSEAEKGDTYGSQEPFSDLVRKDSLTIIRKRWKDVKPEQLAGLIRLCTNCDSSQNYGKELLKNYFKGPENRNQRIEAYYNFVSGVLDLAGEDEAFKEGMKISLHGTEILPKKPYLVDQSMLVSLPDKEDESPIFRQALAVNYVISQLRFMGLQDFEEYYQDRRNFAATEVKGQIRNRQQRLEKKIGSSEVKRLNDKMLGFFRTITAGILTKDKKQSLKEEWPYKVAFTDPLNQKLEAVRSRLASSNQTH